MNSIGANIVKLLLRAYTYPYRKKHLSLSRSVPDKDRPFRIPKDITHSVCLLDGVRAEVFSVQAAKTEILYLHGGGSTRPVDRRYRAVAVRLARALSSRVTLIDHMTGRELVFPSVHDECFSACRAYFSEHGKNAFAAGDSMGANFLLSACVRLRDERIALPCAIGLISPFADLSASGDSYRENCHADPMYSLPRGESFEEHEKDIRRIPFYCGNTDPKDARLSPAFADFEGFPPVLIQCGETETSRSDSEMLRDAMKSKGVPVTLEVYEGMFHDFSILFPMLKESRKAWQNLYDFFRRQIP